MINAKIKIEHVENATHFHNVCMHLQGEQTKKQREKDKGAEHVFARVTSAKHVAREKRDAPAHRGLLLV